ncbi:hypothetical protein E4U17_004793 [Claviceps sp. LM77 group G4]|nr:hypothetical protein E4U17_004793 [Claviceps sp. LM77 group G4]KAG6069386.1 hypothetical protein E4U33_004881 [Claviceps sp. LM78 group G4]KAG6072798.1 hypothetical protein E4U16_005099 [Claviceps sp. LM84 group G4]
MPRKHTKSITTSSSTALSSTPTPPSAAALPASLTDPNLPLPKLIVFDLDYTLWPFWVDTHVSPPLKPSPTRTSATDKFGDDFALYADVPWILQLLPHATGCDSSPDKPIKLGVASRTSAPSLARDLLKMLHLPPLEEGDKPKSKPRRAIDVFDGPMEIYPGSKIRHFEAIHKKTGIGFEDMLFFDDERRNAETERLGLTMRLVPDGLCWQEVERGVEDWRRRRGFRTRSEDSASRG